MTVADVRDLFRYHDWANARCAAAVLALPADVTDRDLGGSFPSIRGVMAHITGAEWIWVERFDGVNPSAIPEWIDTDDLPAIVERLIGISERRRAFLDGLDDGALARPLTFQLLSGKAGASLLVDVCVHMVNHGTYHRGQLAAMLRRVDVPPPVTDFLVYRASVPNPER